VPPFITGYFYAVTSSFADLAIKTTVNRPFVFPIDDVLMTGLLADEINAEKNFILAGPGGNYTFGFGDAYDWWINETIERNRSAGFAEDVMICPVAINSNVAVDAMINKAGLV
jgi:hypothetical protein